MVPQEKFKFKSSEMAINASKNAWVHAEKVRKPLVFISLTGTNFQMFILVLSAK